MKKALVLALSAAMAMGTAQAQQAFKSMGASLEAGTTGIGINVSVPVVTDRLIVSVGYNFPSYTYSKNFNVGEEHVNQYIKPVVDVVTEYKRLANEFNLVDPFTDDIATIKDLSADVDAKINFGNFKLMVQYYPTKQSNFYIAAGVFIGSGDFINIEGRIDKRAWDLYINAMKANEELRKIPVVETITSIINSNLPADKHITIPVEDMDQAIKFRVEDQTFHIKPEDNGRIEAAFKANKVKPYLGVGFGNSIPQKHRLGFQMEVGAYYQSKPVFGSPQEVKDDVEAIWVTDLADIKDIVQKFSWYPQLTFRLTGKIF